MPAVYKKACRNSCYDYKLLTLQGEMGLSGSYHSGVVFLAYLCFLHFSGRHERGTLDVHEAARLTEA